MAQPGISVRVAYGDIPPVGEVLLRIGDQWTRLDPDNAEVVGHALLDFAVVARMMTDDVEMVPGLAEGVIAMSGGGHRQ